MATFEEFGPLENGGGPDNCLAGTCRPRGAILGGSKNKNPAEAGLLFEPLLAKRLGFSCAD